ncbi:MAG: alpha/beta hydrolase [Pseudomonadota bacterium]
MKIVLIRGLIRNQFHWGKFPQALKKYLPTSELYFIDIPGNGARHYEKSPDSIKDMADYCYQTMEKNAIKPPYHLIGISLGGMITMDWAARYEQQIASGVLINSSASNLCQWHQRFNPTNLLTLFKFLTARNNFRRKEACILQLTSNAHQRDWHLINQWAQLHQQFPSTLQNTLRQMLAASRFTTPPINIPICVAASRNDHLVSVRCSEAIAKHYNSDIFFHPTAGHDLPLDQPEWLASQLSSWYSGL